MWMTRVSINHPVFATMVMVALTVLGIVSYNRLRVEAMPDISPPMVQIFVQYPGASPEQVENDVAKPIENAVNTVAGVKRILSASYEGYMFSWIEFRLEIDQTRAVQEVRDKVAQIRSGFPRDVKDPVVQRGGSENDQPVAFYALLGNGMTQRQLTTLAEQVVEKGLERVSGVGRVDLSGTVTRQIQVRVDSAKLIAYGLSVDQVVSALRNANVSVPVGSIANDTVEKIVRVDGRISRPQDFANIIVARKNGAPILLSQLAEVHDTERERNSIARINGVPAVSLAVFKAQDANIVEVGNALKVAADRLKAQLPPGAELRLLRSSSEFVQQAVDNVKRTIIEGALLTVLIVFLFLGSWRSTVITGLTLPIAVIATFTAIYALGFTLNYMTLMALSLCIGLLIDDAIVVRENIVRHLHMGKDHYTAAREGTEEIGLAVLATTLSIVAVFVPIAFMSGIVGRFFYPFGITVAVAVLLSLFVSFTLDPMLSAIWKDPPEGARNLPLVGPVLRRFERGMDRVHAIYGKLLGWALSERRWTLGRRFGRVTLGVPAVHPWRALRTFSLAPLKPRLATITPRGVTLWIATFSFLLSVPLAGLVGAEMMPDSDESFTSVRLTMPVGSSLEYADERVKRVEEALREFKEIDAIDTGIGTEGGKNTARVNLKLVPRSERARTQKDLEQAIRARLAKVPGVEMKVGWGGPIYIALLGNNDAEMTRVIQDLKQRISQIKGITDIDISQKEGTPALSVRLKPELAAEFGITNAQLGASLRALVSGETSGYWLAPDGQNYEVVTQLPRGNRTVIDDISGLTIATGRQLADGSPEVVPLRAIADLVPTINPENIRRQDLQRRIALWANVQGRPSGDAGKEVQALVKEMNPTLPPGLRFDIGGQIQEQQEISAAMLSALALAVIFIYIVLASQFGSFLQPIAIMVSLPLSIVGVMLALAITGTTMNIFSMIGIVFLMGLVTKNAILLVDFANRGQRDGLPIREALLMAGNVRLRPILMTTAAMVFGMLPLALGLGEGAEQQAPMGRAIIGGVITSTLLTLVVVPVVYTYIVAWEKRLRPGARHAKGGAVALHEQPADKA
jgi:HAE1 family hydrophobic/amphiphilic exporter-1